MFKMSENQHGLNTISEEEFKMGNHVLIQGIMGGCACLPSVNSIKVMDPVMLYLMMRTSGGVNNALYWPNFAYSVNLINDF